MNDVEIRKWLKLARCKGVKNETRKTLFDAFGKIDRMIEELIKLSRKPSLVEKISIPSDDEVSRELDLIKESGAVVVHLGSDLYPKLLKDVFNAPDILTVKGKIDLLNTLHFAVVGSRTPAVGSINFTRKITSDLVDIGFTVVSGLAVGIDATAHLAALQCDKPNCGTIAVIGNGLGSDVYPSENQGLYDRIHSGNGLVVSEFEFDAAPVPSRFPRRNATIAGMSIGTLVIEARKNSGSLITARCAHSFNREVYSVPGFPSDERYAGTNSIIKQGIAKITSGISDILEDMRGVLKNDTVREDLLNKSFDFSDIRLEEGDRSDISINDVKGKLDSMLSSAPVGIEQIKCALDNCKTQDILIAILELELEGLIARDFAGKVYKV